VSTPALVVVSFGDAPSDAVLEALGAAAVVVARDAASPAALLGAAGAAEHSVLWLPAWAHVSTSLVTAVGAWRTHDGGMRVARAAARLTCGPRAEIAAPPRVVLSSPGSVVLDGDWPRAADAARVAELGVALEIRLPEDLTQHLEGVNHQSSVAARLRHGAGRDAAWLDLGLRPAWHALRAVLSATGSRREALPHAVIEAYREVLATAKLWELANGTALA
jgi:hypothetical protein